MKLNIPSQVVHNRIVVKAGTNVLIGEDDRLDIEVMEVLVNQIAEIHNQGLAVLLVTSGAIASGRNAVGPDRKGYDIASRQAMAAVGQSRLMHTYQELFGRHDITVAQALLSRENIIGRESYLNIQNTLLALLDWHVVPIVNENDVVAVEEIGVEVFGDNDNLSAMVANLVDADLLIMLSDIDGLHTADPHENPEAKLIPRVERVDEAIEKLAGVSHSSRSRGGMRAKLEAVKIATSSGIGVVLVNGRDPDVVGRVCSGDSIGTYFVPSASKIESRKRWMMSGLSNRGKIVVDAGAAEALLNNNSSLLAPGIQEVNGEFSRGDIIRIVGPDGNRLACGVVSYGAEDIFVIKGKQSDEIFESLGYHYGEAVVHRNNMVLL